MREENRLQVYYHNRLVGVLAQTEKKMIAFEYADEWLENGKMQELWSMNMQSVPKPVESQ